MRLRLLIFFAFFSCLCGYLLFSSLVWYLAEGFSLDKIQFIDTPLLKEETREKKPSLRWILAQDFHYIGKGSQCYVFESRDQLYVLKFFRLDRYKIPPFLTRLPFPYFLRDIQNKRLQKKEEALSCFLQSCQLAYQELREESGLIYLHLGSSKHLQQSVVIHDKLGRPFNIQLDDYPFLIQKKGEMVFPYLSELIEKGRQEEAKKALEDLISLITQRYQKAISDEDAVLHKNLGFCLGKPIFLDIGQFKKAIRIDQNRAFQAELHKMTAKLKVWLKEKDPQLAKDFDKILVSTQI